MFMLILKCQKGNIGHMFADVVDVFYSISTIFTSSL